MLPCFVLKPQEQTRPGPLMPVPPERKLFSRSHENTHCEVRQTFSMEISIYLKALVPDLASPRGDLLHRAERKVISLIVHLTPN